MLLRLMRHHYITKFVMRAYRCNIGLATRCGYLKKTSRAENFPAIGVAGGRARIEPWSADSNWLRALRSQSRRSSIPFCIFHALPFAFASYLLVIDTSCLSTSKAFEGTDPKPIVSESQAKPA